MVKFLSIFRRQPAVEIEPIESVRDSIFSTGIDPASRKMSLWRRQQAAMSRTFLAGIDSLKAVNEAGDLIPVNAAGRDYAMDEAYPDLTQAKLANSRGGYLPITQLEWYANQGFIGWQMCGVLSQNWLIDKACGVPAQDAVRKGYTVTCNDGTQLDPKVLNAIRLADKRMNIAGKLKSFMKKGRIFGIRHALFVIDGIDYSAPFNPDGIRAGSYRGITQIDPYWIAPELDSDAAANPASPEFYNPTWWRVNGKRVHRSHFVIMRNGDEVVDILKPAYLYGGISIPQKIFERVYAAERTANEAPMLLLSKRMMVLKTDTTKAFGPDNKFNEVMETRAQYRNNFGLDVVGTDDEVEQFETSLSELNETIMTQFGLVAAAANVPVTKLMGTPPKGMDATGEYDESSYHEEIESIQEEIGTPFVERHHLCLMRSYIAPKFSMTPVGTEVKWNPLDSYTTKEKAEINKTKADTAKTLADAGAVDGLDIRESLINDPNSDFTAIDPVVPGGPGDRIAQQEADKALEQPVQARNNAKATDSSEDEALYAGIMYRAGDRILLMKRKDGFWAFPAGTIEPGETPMEAACREFREETGQSITRCSPVCITGGTFMLYQTWGEQFTPALNHEHQAYEWALIDQLPTPLHRHLKEQIDIAMNGAPIA